MPPPAPVSLLWPFKRDLHRAEQLLEEQLAASASPSGQCPWSLLQLLKPLRSEDYSTLRHPSLPVNATLFFLSLLEETRHATRSEGSDRTSKEEFERNYLEELRRMLRALRQRPDLLMPCLEAIMHVLRQRPLSAGALDRLLSALTSIPELAHRLPTEDDISFFSSRRHEPTEAALLEFSIILYLHDFSLYRRYRSKAEELVQKLDKAAFDRLLSLCFVEGRFLPESAFLGPSLDFDSVSLSDLIDFGFQSSRMGSSPWESDRESEMDYASVAQSGLLIKACLTLAEVYMDSENFDAAERSTGLYSRLLEQNYSRVISKKLYRAADSNTPSPRPNELTPRVILASHFAKVLRDAPETPLDAPSSKAAFVVDFIKRHADEALLCALVPSGALGRVLSLFPGKAAVGDASWMPLIATAGDLLLSRSAAPLPPPPLPDITDALLDCLLLSTSSDAVASLQRMLLAISRGATAPACEARLLSLFSTKQFSLPMLQMLVLLLEEEDERPGHYPVLSNAQAEDYLSGFLASYSGMRLPSDALSSLLPRRPMDGVCSTERSVPVLLALLLDALRALQRHGSAAMGVALSAIILVRESGVYSSAFSETYFLLLASHFSGRVGTLSWLDRVVRPLPSLSSGVDWSASLMLMMDALLHHGEFSWSFASARCLHLLTESRLLARLPAEPPAEVQALLKAYFSSRLLSRIDPSDLFLLFQRHVSSRSAPLPRALLESALARMRASRDSPASSSSARFCFLREYTVPLRGRLHWKCRVHLGPEVKHYVRLAEIGDPNLRLGVRSGSLEARRGEDEVITKSFSGAFFDFSLAVQPHESIYIIVGSGPSMERIYFDLRASSSSLTPPPKGETCDLTIFDSLSLQFSGFKVDVSPTESSLTETGVSQRRTRLESPPTRHYSSSFELPRSDLMLEGLSPAALISSPGGAPHLPLSTELATASSSLSRHLEVHGAHVFETHSWEVLPDESALVCVLPCCLVESFLNVGGLPLIYPFLTDCDSSEDFRFALEMALTLEEKRSQANFFPILASVILRVSREPWYRAECLDPLFRHLAVPQVSLSQAELLSHPFIQIVCNVFLYREMDDGYRARCRLFFLSVVAEPAWHALLLEPPAGAAPRQSTYRPYFLPLFALSALDDGLYAGIRAAVVRQGASALLPALPSFLSLLLHGTLSSAANPPSSARALLAHVLHDVRTLLMQPQRDHRKPPSGLGVEGDASVPDLRLREVRELMTSGYGATSKLNFLTLLIHFHGQRPYPFLRAAIPELMALREEPLAFSVVCTGLLHEDVLLFWQQDPAGGREDSLPNCIPSRQFITPMADCESIPALDLSELRLLFAMLVNLPFPAQSSLFSTVVAFLQTLVESNRSFRDNLLHPECAELLFASILSLGRRLREGLSGSPSGSPPSTLSPLLSSSPSPSVPLIEAHRLLKLLLQSILTGGLLDALQNRPTARMMDSLFHFAPSLEAKMTLLDIFVVTLQSIVSVPLNDEHSIAITLQELSVLCSRADYFPASFTSVLRTMLQRTSKTQAEMTQLMQSWTVCSLEHRLRQPTEDPMSLVRELQADREWLLASSSSSRKTVFFFALHHVLSENPRRVVGTLQSEELRLLSDFFQRETTTKSSGSAGDSSFHPPSSSTSSSLSVSSLPSAAGAPSLLDAIIAAAAREGDVRQVMRRALQSLRLSPEPPTHQSSHSSLPPRSPASSVGDPPVQDAEGRGFTPLSQCLLYFSGIVARGDAQYRFFFKRSLNPLGFWGLDHRGCPETAPTTEVETSEGSRWKLDSHVLRDLTRPLMKPSYRSFPSADRISRLHDSLYQRYHARFHADALDYLQLILFDGELPLQSPSSSGVEAVNCTLVTESSTRLGVVVLSKECLYFIPGLEQSGRTLSLVSGIGGSSPSKSCGMFGDVDGYLPCRVKLSSVQSLREMRHLLRHVGVEMVLRTGKQLFLAFKDPSDRKRVLRELRDRSVELRHEKPAEEQLRQLTDRWKNYRMSTFHYLLQVNALAGRSYNDITEYYVFPWILRDYSSSELALEDPARAKETYRDLSRPVGALNEERFVSFQEKFDLTSQITEFPNIHPYFYGTHYSNPCYVLSFLVRLEPFASGHKRLQGGRFDLADRLFISVEDSWHSVNINTQDVREIIPEFFYFPQFLLNLNLFDLGKTQAGVAVGDVKLPPWSHDDPTVFVDLHRRALEGDHVSRHINEWIDLIFGIKQSGREAVHARNVFYPLSYECNAAKGFAEFSEDSESILGQIREFGQTPSQLFSTRHPRRKESQKRNQYYFRITASQCAGHFRLLEKPTPANPKLQTAWIEGGRTVHWERRHDRFSTCFLDAKRNYLLYGFPDGALKLFVDDRLASHFICPSVVTAVSYEPSSRSVAAGTHAGLILVFRYFAAGPNSALKLIVILSAHLSPIRHILSSSLFPLLLSCDEAGNCVEWSTSRHAILRLFRRAPTGGPSDASDEVLALSMNQKSGSILVLRRHALDLFDVNGRSLTVAMSPPPGAEMAPFTTGRLIDNDQYIGDLCLVTGHENGEVLLWSYLDKHQRRELHKGHCFFPFASREPIRRFECVSDRDQHFLIVINRAGECAVFTDDMYILDRTAL